MTFALPIRCIFLAFVTTAISPLVFAKMYTDSDKNDAYSPYTLYMEHCNKTQEQVDSLEAQQGPLAKRSDQLAHYYFLLPQR
ncbi:hypothetical protein [Pseudomonas meliae]|uniref:hypothetical protein n=1 Tax=Pseudomonas meliae TaxID=86176 RepID=UPI0005C9A86A|nr:hypothetical protein [Pseudomonas meliae]